MFVFKLTVAGLLCYLSISGNPPVIKASEPYLLVTNNGPAILDSNITFLASLMDYSKEEDLNYIFNDGVQKAEKNGGRNVTFTMPCTRDLYKEGFYNMTVTVERKFLLIKEKIAFNHTIFQLGEDLFGHIEVLRNGSSTNGMDEVGTGENLTMIAKVHDPSGYLQHATVEYVWSIDGERHRSSQSKLNYTYTHPGSSVIVVLVFATLPSSEILFGLFMKELTVKVPVNSISVTGNPFVHHDEVLHLNVSCSGTPPFEYCWDILSTNRSSDENFTCTVIVTNTCFFPINRYFQKDGSYHIAIHISNDVKQVHRNLEIMVYNVTPKPQLSTVIIPIVCSLLTLIIIAAGITYYRQQRRHLQVEVASFDFHDNSETYLDRTSFEQLWDSFKGLCYAPRTVAENDFAPSEIEPLLT